MDSILRAVNLLHNDLSTIYSKAVHMQVCLSESHDNGRKMVRKSRKLRGSSFPNEIKSVQSTELAVRRKKISCLCAVTRSMKRVILPNAKEC